MAGGTQTFKAVVGKGPGGALLIPVPFDPDTIWGKKPRHHVRGRVGSCDWRGTIDPRDDGFTLKLGPAWARDNPVIPGMTVDVSLAAEGPQRDALDSDIAAALAKEPKAGAFFDGLAQFYRKAYLKWIDGTKTRPDERKRRIAELVKLLKAGVKQRPN